MTWTASPEAQYLAHITRVPEIVAQAWIDETTEEFGYVTTVAKNPLALPWDGSGANGYTWHARGDVTNYPSWEDGIRAVHAALQTALYYGVRQSLHSGDPWIVADAIEASIWRNDHYGRSHDVRNSGRISKRIQMMQLREPVFTCSCGKEFVMKSSLKGHQTRTKHA